MRQNFEVDDSNLAALETAVTHLSPSQLAASLNEALDRWDGNTPVWVFAYGSLIWHPEISFDQKIPVVAHGYHRSLCLWSREHRGTPERPGLVLGLEPGGSCRGVAFRIPAEIAVRELEILWAREMNTGSYEPRWLALQTHGSAPQRFRALGFVMNRHAAEYAGELDRATVVRTLLTARGKRGSSADYLFATVRTLSEYGIRDRHLAELAHEVEHALAG